MGQEKEEEHSKHKKNWLEWLVFTISILLILGIIGYLVYKTYTHKVSPPEIEVTYSPSPTHATPYRYHLSIENSGGETAEEVIIELVLKQNGEVIEKSEVNIPFVPPASKCESWANFSKNPALTDTILVRVVSFRKP